MDRPIDQKFPPQVVQLKREIDQMVQTVNIIRKMEVDGAITTNECRVVTEAWQETGKNTAPLERIDKFKRLLGKNFGPRRSAEIYEMMISKTKIAKEEASLKMEEIKRIMREQKHDGATMNSSSLNPAGLPQLTPINVTQGNIPAKPPTGAAIPSNLVSKGGNMNQPPQQMYGRQPQYAPGQQPGQPMMQQGNAVPVTGMQPSTNLPQRQMPYSKQGVPPPVDVSGMSYPSTSDPNYMASMNQTGGNPMSNQAPYQHYQPNYPMNPPGSNQNLAAPPTNTYGMNAAPMGSSAQQMYQPKPMHDNNYQSQPTAPGGAPGYPMQPISQYPQQHQMQQNTQIHGQHVMRPGMTPGNMGNMNANMNMNMSMNTGMGVNKPPGQIYAPSTNPTSSQFMPNTTSPFHVNPSNAPNSTAPMNMSNQLNKPQQGAAVPAAVKVKNEMMKRKSDAAPESDNAKKIKKDMVAPIQPPAKVLPNQQGFPSMASGMSGAMQTQSAVNNFPLQSKMLMSGSGFNDGIELVGGDGSKSTAGDMDEGYSAIRKREAENEAEISRQQLRSSIYIARDSSSGEHISPPPNFDRNGMLVEYDMIKVCVANVLQRETDTMIEEQAVKYLTETLHIHVKEILLNAITVHKRRLNKMATSNIRNVLKISENINGDPSKGPVTQNPRIFSNTATKWGPDVKKVIEQETLVESRKLKELKELHEKRILQELKDYHESSQVKKKGPSGDHSESYELIYEEQAENKGDLTWSELVNAHVRHDIAKHERMSMPNVTRPIARSLDQISQVETKRHISIADMHARVNAPFLTVDPASNPLDESESWTLQVDDIVGSISKRCYPKRGGPFSMAMGSSVRRANVGLV